MDATIHSNPDANTWALEYQKNHPDCDLDDIRGWFANAMMAMHDHIHQTKKEIDYSIDVRICGVVRTQIRNLRRPEEIKIVVTKKTLTSILETEVKTQRFLQWLKIIVLPSLAG